MESDRSQESIAHIPVDSLIWSQQQSINQSRESSPLQIYSVSKNIKNPQILQHIKPDYGSLGQFMKNVAISKDLLMHNRKKKNDLQDDWEQKKMRITLKDKNLDKVIKQPNATQFQKTIASKMIVENLFHNKFGLSLQNFTLQNTKPQHNNHTYSSISELTAIFDQLMIWNKDDSIARYSELKNDAPVLVRKKYMTSSKEVKLLSFGQRYQKIKIIQNNYLPLKKQSSFQLINAAGSQNSIVCQNLIFSQSITSFNVLASQLVKIDISKVKSIRFTNVNFSYQMFSAALDYFTDKHCYTLMEVAIQKCSLGSSEKLALRIKQFIESSSVKRVELSEMNLTSRDFCVICLGVGARSAFHELSLRDNKIGEIAKKCLDVLLKFNKEVKIDLTNNPIEKQLKGSSSYSRCFS